MASLGKGAANGAAAPILSASAREKTGIEAILDAVEARRNFLEGKGLPALRRRQAARWMARRIEAELGRRGLAGLGGAEKLAEEMDRTQPPRPFARTAEILGDI